jgi:hypothetical protein
MYTLTFPRWPSSQKINTIHAPGTSCPAAYNSHIENSNHKPEAATRGIKRIKKTGKNARAQSPPNMTTQSPFAVQRLL